jgi:hypothetical protein
MYGLVLSPVHTHIDTAEQHREERSQIGQKFNLAVVRRL